MSAYTRLFSIVALLATLQVGAVRAEDERAAAAFVRGNTRFAIALYRRLKSGSDNLVVSPYSVSTAGTLAFAGASGATAEAIAGALHLPLRGEDLYKACAAVSAGLIRHRDDTGVVLRNASSLWLQAGFTLSRDFLSTLEKYLHALIRNVNYVDAAEAARAEMNQWVAESTGGKISEMMPKGVLDSLTRIVILNAIYFKGAWRTRFDPSATREGIFHAPGASVGVPMMQQKGEFRYGQQPEADILELPYGGGELSMVLALPKQRDGLKALEEQLNLHMLERWLHSLNRSEVQVFLPRFRISSSFGLKSALSEMGMAKAFDPVRADFSRITGGKNDLYVSRVLHKALLEVNEEGAEAAAATGMLFSLRTAQFVPEFRADHPFLFFIRDGRTGLILFLGRVMNPSL